MAWNPSTEQFMLSLGCQIGKSFDTSSECEKARTTLA
jgi:hypothetical protein